jgi:transcriptional regulator with XRE-family HTH domain
MDPETRERIRAWLRFYMDARSWTHERMATELGVSHVTITNVLNGTRTAGLDLLIRMHRRLHRSADDLLDTDPPPLNPANRKR